MAVASGRGTLDGEVFIIEGRAPRIPYTVPLHSLVTEDTSHSVFFRPSVNTQRFRGVWSGVRMTAHWGRRGRVYVSRPAHRRGFLSTSRSVSLTVWGTNEKPVFFIDFR